MGNQKLERLGKPVIVLIVFTIVFSILMLSIPADTAHATGPLTEIYLTNHPAIQTPKLSALNTTANKDRRQSYILDTGYDGHYYTNVKAGPKSSSSIMRTLGNDAICTVFGHANHGRMICIDNSNNLTRIAANATSQSCNYSLAANYGNTTNKLKKMRFIHWAGCNTHGTDSSYGNFTSKCKSLGVDVVVTQKSEFYPTVGTFLNMAIFKYGYSNNTTIKANVQSAVGYTSTQYSGNSTLADTVDIYIGGNDLTSKFKPASYGS